MGTVIASYAERRFDGERRFELHADCIVIVGSASLGARFELKVPLDSLIAAPDKMWARPNGFWSGVWMLLVFASLSMGFGSVLSSWWKALFGVVACGGALLALATARRVEWAIFRHAVGTEAVTIARSGKDRETFQRFVEAVSSAISARKK